VNVLNRLSKEKVEPHSELQKYKYVGEKLVVSRITITNRADIAENKNTEEKQK